MHWSCRLALSSLVAGVVWRPQVPLEELLDELEALELEVEEGEQDAAMDG